MVKLNLLTESFIVNSGVAGQRIVNAQEMEGLITQSGNVLTFSGSKVSLLFDLGYQKDVDRFKYSFTPTSLSGITVKYGRSQNDLFTGAPSIVGNSIEVLPTQSGYTYPRYFYLLHDTPSGSPITLSGITILNNDTTVDFGTSGTVSSITITPVDGVEGFSDVQEVAVFNDGSIPADIYVSVDTYGLSSDIFDKIEIAPTATGTFRSINEDMTMPDSIPWEWGDFTLHTSLTDDNKLTMVDTSATSIALTVGQATVFNSPSIQTFNNNAITAKDSNGEDVFVTTDQNNRMCLFHARKGTVLIGSNPSVIPSAIEEQRGHGIAWDGNNRIYYMNNSSDQTVRYYQISTNTHHTLTTVPFFVRATRFLTVASGKLYIGGGLSSAGTSTSVGTQFWELDLNTLVSTQKTSLPQTPSAINAKWGYLNGFIYHTFSSSTNFWRYNIALNAWQALAVLPSAENSVMGVMPSVSENLIYVVIDDNSNELYSYNPATNIFTGPLFTSINASIPFTAESCALGASDSILFSKEDQTGSLPFSLMPIKPVPDPVLSTSFSGNWISPVIKLDNTENYHRLLLDYTHSGINSFLKADSGISVDNFEFRGSNTPPSADNFIEDFDEALDADAFIAQGLNEFTVVAVSGGALTFSHDFQNATDTPLNRGYLYFSLPITSAGKIQYKFWWKPTSKGTIGTANWSAFYIVPFLNTVDDGTVPDRNPDSLRRTAADYIYLRFGTNTDANGIYTAIGVNNGSSTTNHAINATAGSYYEVTFILDWDTGNYTLYFAGAQVGTGTIPLIQMIKMDGQHSYEFYSTSDNIDSQEQFKKLTINRIGTIPIEDDNIAIPVHIQDPLFGRTGSLQWFPTTVNSALIPKFKYVQFRLTFRSNGIFRTPTVNTVKFPVVLKLDQVPVGGSKSFFLRYNFPVSNSINTTTAFIKAWMATDKN